MPLNGLSILKSLNQILLPERIVKALLHLSLDELDNPHSRTFCPGYQTNLSDDACEIHLLVASLIFLSLCCWTGN